MDYVKNDTIHLDSITHSCPIDWRTKQPVIINATYQWFINIETIRGAAIDAINKITIHTSMSTEKRSENQLSQKIQQRPYWCISRQRAWGTPIPAFYRKDTGEVIVSENIVNHLMALLQKHGNMDFWWKADINELIPDSELKHLGCTADDIIKGNVRDSEYKFCFQIHFD